MGEVERYVERKEYLTHGWASSLIAVMRSDHPSESASGEQDMATRRGIR